MGHRRRVAPLALLALGLGVAALLYRGPGRGIIRGHGGDVAAAMLLYAAASVAPGLARRGWRARAAVALGTALTLELGQLIWTGRGLAGELLVGGTFDPRDLLAYALGVALGVATERAGRRPPAR